MYIFLFDIDMDIILSHWNINAQQYTKEKRDTQLYLEDILQFMNKILSTTA